jgi:sulfur carrier protein ThiS
MGFIVILLQVRRQAGLSGGVGAESPHPRGGRVARLLFEEGGSTVLSGLMVMVNDRTYTGNEINRESIRLHEGDKVSILYFISGG